MLDGYLSNIKTRTLEDCSWETAWAPRLRHYSKTTPDETNRCPAPTWTDSVLIIMAVPIMSVIMVVVVMVVVMIVVMMVVVVMLIIITMIVIMTVVASRKRCYWKQRGASHCTNESELAEH